MLCPYCKHPLLFGWVSKTWYCTSKAVGKNKARCFTIGGGSTLFIIALTVWVKIVAVLSYIVFQQTA